MSLLTFYYVVFVSAILPCTLVLMMVAVNASTEPACMSLCCVIEISSTHLYVYPTQSQIAVLCVTLYCHGQEKQHYFRGFRMLCVPFI